VTYIDRDDRNLTAARGIVFATIAGAVIWTLLALVGLWVMR
jgi:hypothetical protein